MNPLVIDVETTTFQKGNPFSERNQLCYYGVRGNVGNDMFDIEFTLTPYGDFLSHIQEYIDKADLLVGFSIKFDMHWSRRYGLRCFHKPWFDLQYAYYCIRAQEIRLPSLNDALDYFHLGSKLAIVEEEYWNKGIDTPDVPRETLEAYLAQDLMKEFQLFQAITEYLKDKPKLKRLIWEGCQDQKLTAEMEWNGLKYNINKSVELGNQILVEVSKLDMELNRVYDNPHVKWTSNDDISAVLYGGILKYQVREPVEKILKSGKISVREHWVENKEELTRLVTPFAGSEVKKAGYFKTDEKTLRSLPSKGIAKEIIGKLLQRSKLEKQVGTYLHGIPKLYKEMDWKDEILHPQLLHSITISGRLASAKPNGQNLDDGSRKCIMTRF